MTLSTIKILLSSWRQYCFKINAISEEDKADLTKALINAVDIYARKLPAHKRQDFLIQVHRQFNTEIKSISATYTKHFLDTVYCQISPYIESLSDGLLRLREQYSSPKNFSFSLISIAALFFLPGVNAVKPNREEPEAKDSFCVTLTEGISAIEPSPYLQFYSEDMHRLPKSGEKCVAKRDENMLILAVNERNQIERLEMFHGLMQLARTGNEKEKISSLKKLDNLIQAYSQQTKENPEIFKINAALEYFLKVAEGFKFTNKFDQILLQCLQDGIKGHPLKKIAQILLNQAADNGYSRTVEMLHRAFKYPAPVIDKARENVLHRQESELFHKHAM